MPNRRRSPANPASRGLFDDDPGPALTSGAVSTTPSPGAQNPRKSGPDPRAGLDPLPHSAKAALAEAAAAREALILRLVPLALALALKAGPHGLTVADLRLKAVQEGILTGGEQGRSLSFLGKVMQRAGLRATDRMRRSCIAKSNGNLHRVWVHPSVETGA